MQKTNVESIQVISFPSTQKNTSCFEETRFAYVIHRSEMLQNRFYVQNMRIPQFYTSVEIRRLKTRGSSVSF